MTLMLPGTALGKNSCSPAGDPEGPAAALDGPPEVVRTAVM